MNDVGISTGIDIALLICRFVFDAAALLLWGVSVFLCTLVPAALRVSLWQQLRNFRRLAWCGIIVAVICYLPLQAARIGDGWQDAFNSAVLHGVLGGTSVGLAWCWQSTTLVLMLLLKRIMPGRNLPANAIVSGALLASLSVTGHAVMDDGWRGTAHQLNDVLHLLSGGAWTGALLVVVALLPRLQSADFADSADVDAAKLALMRFSTAGHVAVLLVLLSGGISTFLILGGWPLNQAFPYQRLLSLKIAVVVLMVGIALANRYLLVPRMRHWTASSRLFRWATLAEIALALAVILLVAGFGMLEPG